MAKPLHGRWDFYRVRFGGYRLLYSISEKEKTVFLISVGKRDEIYAR